MPCLAIHLAVAKKYLEKHQDENKDEFELGSIAPDIDMININEYINGVDSDKNSHHFGENYNTTDAIEYMKKKVNFNKFIKNNDLSTSFLRGYFLHLICDFLFFGEYITKDNIIGYSQEEIKKKGYEDYNRITPVLIKKYDLIVPDMIKDMISGHSEGQLELLSLEQVYKFIDDMSNIDIYEFYKSMK